MYARTRTIESYNLHNHLLRTSQLLGAEFADAFAERFAGLYDLPLACHHWIFSCRATTCHEPRPSSSLQRVCGIRRARGRRTRGGHLMSKYNKSISVVDPVKLILLDSFAVLSPM